MHRCKAPLQECEGARAEKEAGELRVDRAGSDLTIAPLPAAGPPGWTWEEVLDALPDGVSIVSGSGVILFVSARAAELYGFDRTDVTGRNVRDLTARGHVDQSASMEVMRTGADVTTTQTVRGGRRLLVTGRPVLGPRGEISHIITTQRDVTELHDLMGRLSETTQLSERYRTELTRMEMREVHAQRIVARSVPMRRVWDLASRCAQVDAAVLLLGETGTGKGVFAKLIHQTSARSGGPFIEVNCGAIPETLIEAELFGYLRGAFTGADPRGKAGLLELAHGGTLLLDEMGELPLSVQVKLLRFLEDGEVQPLGGTVRKRLDVRIVAATNRDLSAMISRGRFRQDLFYRLNVLTVQLPPLRERREDIPPLVEMMLAELERKLRRRRRMTPRAMDLITRYGFPGNVRELWNLVERLVITTDAEAVEAENLPEEVLNQARGRRGRPGTGTLRQVLEQTEREALAQAMGQGRSQSRAAGLLGISQATLSRKLRRYRLAPGD